MTSVDWWTAAVIFPVVFAVAAACSYWGWPILHPQGQHRAVPAPAAETVPLAALIASGDAETTGAEWCPECTSRRPHIFHTDSTRTCCGCHTTTAGDQ